MSTRRTLVNLLLPNDHASAPSAPKMGLPRVTCRSRAERSKSLSAFEVDAAAHSLSVSRTVDEKVDGERERAVAGPEFERVHPADLQ